MRVNVSFDDTSPGLQGPSTSTILWAGIPWGEAGTRRSDVLTNRGETDSTTGCSDKLGPHRQALGRAPARGSGGERDRHWPTGQRGVGQWVQGGDWRGGEAEGVA